MDRQLDVAFREEADTLKQVETLLAWRELEISEERPGCGALRQLHHSTRDDLKVQVGAFVNGFFTLHEQLKACSPGVRRIRTRQLQQLWKRFQDLGQRLARAW